MAMDEIDFKSIFPTNKIKAQIRAEENIGKIYTTAVEKVGAASAIFLENMVHQAMNDTEQGPSGNQDEGNVNNGEINHSVAARSANILTKEILEALLQKQEYKFLDVVEIDPKALSKYGKGKSKQSKKKAESSAGAPPKKKQRATKKKIMGKDVVDVMRKDQCQEASSDKKSEHSRGEGDFGLDLNELVQQEDHFDGIIEDDEDYD
jgi:hypothetical protein